MARLHTQQRSSASHWSVGSFFHRLQTTSRTVRSCCQACWRCTSKSDPLDLLRSTRRCPATFRLEACLRSTYHLDLADLPRHVSYGDRRPAAGRRPIVLATNRNGGKLRLYASSAGRKEGSRPIVKFFYPLFRPIFRMRGFSVGSWEVNTGELQQQQQQCVCYQSVSP